MTPIGPVGNVSPDSIASHTIRRSYPFSVAPLVKFNTFTTPTIDLTPPHLIFINGATVESNKLYEAAIEASSLLAGIEICSVATDYIMSLDCYLGTEVTVPANISDTGFIGIEMSSQLSATLSNTPTGSSIQLKRQLNSQTKWTFSVYKGFGAVGIHTSFDVPIPSDGGTTSNWGSKVRIYYDPINLITRAYVNDIVRAELGILGINRSSELIWGVLLYNGVQSGACSIKAMWAGAEVTSYNTHRGDNSQV